MNGSSATREELLAVLARVLDPEVPVLNIVEMGIVRDAAMETDGSVRVAITPTYSGCPAMHEIETQILAALRAAGYLRARVETIFREAWTTDWMTAEAREKLRAYGIAPPGQVEDGPLESLGQIGLVVACPYCGSRRTELRAQFGATACKSMHYCRGCDQPFEHFKAF